MNSSDVYFEGSELSVSDKMIRQLAKCSEDLTKSLNKFSAQREKALTSQKVALVAYEEEMKIINGEVDDLEYYEEQPLTVDHNVLRHLNIDRNSEMYHEFEHVSLTRIKDDVNEEEGRPPVDMKFPVELGEKPPMPSIEEKKKIREKVFDFLDESRMEEMRLELELEQAKLKDELKLVEELSEALYLLQRVNADKLKRMLVEYQPAGIGRNWGADPEYNTMLRNLNDITMNKSSSGKSSSKVDLFQARRKKKSSRRQSRERENDVDQEFEEYTES